MTPHTDQQKWQQDDEGGVVIGSKDVEETQESLPNQLQPGTGIGGDPADALRHPPTVTLQLAGISVKNLLIDPPPMLLAPGGVIGIAARDDETTVCGSGHKSTQDRGIAHRPRQHGGDHTGTQQGGRGQP
ncbi:MAG TPA: hypothetical protein DIC52_14425, partial [Candidatus Latescibacteria bacterium]|nr:hypothetical protein [Candidatus Latescibacterota bacterium]